MFYKTAFGWRLGPALGFLVLLTALGCDAGETVVKPAGPPKIAPPTKRKSNKIIDIEVDQDGKRRVVVAAVVCLREGQLEGFLTHRRAKDHEYILTTDCDARAIHQALLAAGAVPGTPARWTTDNKYVPASGSVIKVSVRYPNKAGKLVTEPAQQWVRNAIDGKPLNHDWVFCGSRLIPDPDDPTKPPFYGANGGDVICIYNMPDAMLDIPIKNPNVAPEMRVYVAWTEKIPPEGTRVEVILEPVAEDKRGELPAESAPESKRGEPPAESAPLTDPRTR